MYFAFAQSAFQTRLAYRGQVWANLFSRLIQVFAYIAIWMAVYQSTTSVEGVTLPDMVTYAVIGGAVMTAWEWRSLLNTVGNSVSSGDVAVYLLKPLRYPLYLFATECGNLIFKLAVVVAPVVIVAALTYGMLPPASLFHGLMFVVFWALSFVILFLLATLCGLLAFWLLTAFSLEWLLQGILTLLSGTAIPLWFFPRPLAAVAEFLPFAWVAYHPIAVYLGKTPFLETWIFLGVGLGWAALLAVAVALLWRKAALRITVQGG
jgi:ABC-2 type transport system permease protein